MRSELEVVCTADDGGLIGMETPWRNLVERASIGEWFAGPDWVLPWMESFGRSSRLVVYFVFRKGKLIGAAPFVIKNERRIGSALLESPFNSHTRRVGWLAETDTDDVVRAVVSHVRSRHPLAAVRLPHLLEVGALSSQIKRVQRDLHLGSWTCEESLSASVDWPMGWSDYVEHRDARFMRNLRRHLRRTSEVPNWRITQFRGFSELSKGWAQLLDVERKSWKHEQRTSIASEPGAECFYRSVAERFAAQGRLALWILSFCDEPVAHALVVESRSTAYLLKNSFVEKYRSHSPGVAVVWRAMEQSASSGLQRFDLLGDAESWKIPLSTSTPRHVSWTIFPRYHVMGQLESFSQFVLRPTYRRLRKLFSSTRSQTDYLEASRETD